MKIYGVYDCYAKNTSEFAPVIEKYFLCKDMALEYISSEDGDIQNLDDWLVELELIGAW